MKKGLKIVTIGGGSSYTPELVEGLIKRSATLPVREFWLVDIEAGREKLEIVGGLARRMVAKAGADIDIHLSLDRAEALKDADFVTTQIRVGQLKARELDETIPLSHGVIGQETNGAGGMFKAFRTIPVIMDIARDMQKYCKNAWMINFSNPAGMVTEALLRHGPSERVIGLCNVPIHIERNIAAFLGVETSRVKAFFAGLNHMVFGTQVMLDGLDITSELIEKIINSETGLSSVKNVTAVAFEKEFLRALGVIPCPYHNYYFKRDFMLEEELKQFKEGNIRAQVVSRLEAELFEIYKDEHLDIKPPQLEKRGGAFYSEAACSLINSLYNNTMDIQPVNTRNNGAIHGIDDDSAVEVSSVITGSGPKPLNVGKLPIAVNGLIQQIKTFEHLTVEAALEGSYEKAILALTLNPLTPSEKTAKILVDEMLKAHKEFLPQFK